MKWTTRWRSALVYPKQKDNERKLLCIHCAEELFIGEGGSAMIVTAKGRQWGELTTEIRKNEVVFCVHGPVIPQVWRVWGGSEGKEPILIGVPEPDGEQMVLRRGLSKLFLKNCGYWPELPQWYVAGERYSRETTAAQGQEIPKADEGGIIQRQCGAYRCRSCRFDPQQEFPLAYAFSVCTIREGRAELWTDEKTGRPVGRPEQLTE